MLGLDRVRLGHRLGGNRLNTITSSQRSSHSLLHADVRLTMIAEWWWVGSWSVGRPAGAAAATRFHSLVRSASTASVFDPSRFSPTLTISLLGLHPSVWDVSFGSPCMTLLVKRSSPSPLASFSSQLVSLRSSPSLVSPRPFRTSHRPPTPTLRQLGHSNPLMDV